ncbi:MAG: hypothetical protein HY506_02150 [Candidatus Yanofskybacteria bacterium]|nr:hypothetical protein [Candidatus Yanofskybacteria bacterium]
MLKTPTIIFIFFAAAAFFITHNFAYAYFDDLSDNSPQDLLQKIPGFKLPKTPFQTHDTGLTKPLVDQSGLDVANLGQFLNIKNWSKQDVLSGLKEVAVLTINLFVIVIETTAGILKALVPFLQ